MTTDVRRRTDMGWVVRHGIIGGIVAGLVFAVAEMIGSVLMGDQLLAPLSAFASVPIGQPPPEIDMSTALVVGPLWHLLLSVIYAVVFAVAVQMVPALRSSTAAIVVAATVWGTVLWAVNFYVVAPAIGRPWFTMAPVIPQFIFHAFFYGTVLGLYLASVRPAGWREPDR